MAGIGLGGGLEELKALLAQAGSPFKRHAELGPFATPGTSALYQPGLPGLRRSDMIEDRRADGAAARKAFTYNYANLRVAGARNPDPQVQAYLRNLPADAKYDVGQLVNQGKKQLRVVPRGAAGAAKIADEANSLRQYGREGGDQYLPIAASQAPVNYSPRPEPPPPDPGLLDRLLSLRGILRPYLGLDR